MQKLNKDISLVLTNHRKVERRFYAFANLKEAKAIETLKKLYFGSMAKKYKYAAIYSSDKVVFRAINGIEQQGEKTIHYGADISLFKLRVYVNEGENPPPFYSSTIMEQQSPEKAYYELINLHAKGTYRKALTVAIIYAYDNNRVEHEVARFKKDFRTGYINEHRSEALKELFN